MCALNDVIIRLSARYSVIHPSYYQALHELLMKNNILLGLCPRDGVDALQRIELEVILFVEPSALEKLQRQSGPARKGECVDGQLHMRVRLFPCLRFVVEDVDVSIANL